MTLSSGTVQTSRRADLREGSDSRVVAVTVREALIAQVTDLGRKHHSRRGIPVNGASDQHSACVANILVGNARGAPVIEIVATDFEMTVHAPLLIAVTGAQADIAVDGVRCQSGGPLALESGSSISIRRIRNGMRCYLAIRGRIEVPYLLGSCAPDPMLGIDQVLAPGGSMTVTTTYRPIAGHPFPAGPLFNFRVPSAHLFPRFGALPVPIDIVKGPHARQFPDGLRLMTSTSYCVSPSSNHVGLRVEGAVPARGCTGELLSRGVPVGAIEVPPSHELLVLLRGRIVTAGYPVVAVATRAAQAALGQLYPGAQLAFRVVSREEAIRDYCARESELDTLAARVTTAFEALCLA